VRSVCRDVTASGSDHERELSLVVEQARYARHVHVSIGADYARDLLVEEDGELGRLHAALGDVIGVVEPDPEELPRLHRRQQAHALERVSIAGPAIDDVISLDHAGSRLRVDLEYAELHDGSGISTGACSGA
jgi:hypothetical protein